MVPPVPFSSQALLQLEQPLLLTGTVCDYVSHIIAFLITCTLHLYSLAA